VNVDLPFAEQVDPFNTGFIPYVPPVVEEPRWQITGDDSQVVTCMLEPSEAIQTEPGSMMFMSPSIKTDVECDPCAGCIRKLAGEDFVKVALTNEGGDAAYVGLTPNYPAKVVPIELSQIGGKFIGKSGAVMSSLGDVNISTSTDCNPCTSCFSGLGGLRQLLEGSGTAFLAAGGTILTKDLAEGESLVIDTDSLVGFSESVSFSVRPSGGPVTCCCGGEGMFNTVVTGPGTVVVQSMSFKKFVKAVAPPQAAGMNRHNDQGGGGGEE